MPLVDVKPVVVEVKPKPKAAVPKIGQCPMGESPKVREKFNRLVKAIPLPLGPGDTLSVLELARILTALDEAESIIGQTGRFDPETGRLSAAAIYAQKQQSEAIKWLREFGLTPVALRRAGGALKEEEPKAGAFDA